MDDLQEGHVRSTKSKGLDIHYFSYDGKLLAVGEAMGLRVCRLAEETPALGPYVEEEFADFARKDIARRVIEGE